MDRYYLAHPFDSRIEMRQKELQWEAAYEIEIVNPFYDLNRDDVKAIDEGYTDRYFADPCQLVNRDLTAILNSNGVIAYVNGMLSYGTIMEIVWSHIFHIPVYLICTNGHHGHPWLKYHTEDIFISFEDFEEGFLSGL